MTKKMQIDRLEQNELHKLIMKCFGTLTDGAVELGFTKVSAYRWIDDRGEGYGAKLPLYTNPKNAMHRKYRAIMKEGFKNHKKNHAKNIAKLEKILLG